MPLYNRKPHLRSLVVVLVATLVALASGLIGQSTASEARPPVRVRKSVVDLTPAERRAFVDALLKLKTTASPFDDNLSYYDQFVAWHVAAAHCDPTDPTTDHVQMSHKGPMFLPWHRQYLLLLEQALTEVSRRPIAVPYWDWTDPRSVASVFAPDFMGGDGDPGRGYAVTTGPFSVDGGRWPLNVRSEGVVYDKLEPPYLARRLGGSPPLQLPTTGDVDEALAAPEYDVEPYDISSDHTKSFRAAVEGNRARPVSTTACMPDGTFFNVGIGAAKMHNVVHPWVGGFFQDADGRLRWGTLTDVTTSPNDPVFFLHHSNVDRLWAKWQEDHPEKKYMPETGYEHNNADSVMHPFDAAGETTPRDVEDIANLGYTYQEPRRAPA